MGRVITGPQGGKDRIGSWYAQAHQVPECPQPYPAVWTMWKDHEKFSHGHDNPRSCFSASYLVQATSDGACDQEGQGCNGYPTFHPAGEVVHQRKANGSLCRVSNHGRPRADEEP